MRRITVREYKIGEGLFGKRVIALGFFDGVHLGHREILADAVKTARELSLPSAVFTFSSITGTAKDSGQIYSAEKKAELIEECGIDELIIADFDSLKSLSPEDFIEKTLVSDLGCALALCGFDFRFGYRAMGNAELLERELKRLGSSLICHGEVTADGEKISSTRIKALLCEGKVKRAGELLGKPYSVNGRVEHGLGLGKTFGFPTLNTEIEEGAAPLKRGVYKCEVTVDGRTHPALSNVGVCPTVGDRKKHIETYLIDLKEDLYGKDIVISFLDFIRPEERFNSVDDLIMQIKLDINTAFGQKE